MLSIDNFKGTMNKAAIFVKKYFYEVQGFFLVEGNSKRNLECISEKKNYNKYPGLCISLFLLVKHAH